MVEESVTEPAIQKVEETIPADYFLFRPNISQKATEVTKNLPQMEIKAQEYKQSVYLAFQPDALPAYDHCPVSFTQLEVQEAKSEHFRSSSSCFTQQVKLHPAAESKISETYSAVEGDAFRPVLHSECRVGQLGDFVSYANILKR